jgi:ATP-dependent protease ClpP protease subunit
MIKNKIFYDSSNPLALREYFSQPGPTDPKNWSADKMFSVTNKGPIAARNNETTAVIRIYDEIGFWGIEPNDIVEQIEAIEADNIELRVNSPGGNVFDGIAILSTLMATGKPITGFIDGIAASIASVIIMAADTITMPENTRMMIHNPNVMAFGEADDLRKTADILDMVKDDIVATYRRHATITKKEISDLMTSTTYLSAATAVEKGFAHTLVPLSDKGGDDNPAPDDVLNQKQAKAYIDLLEFEMTASQD